MECLTCNKYIEKNRYCSLFCNNKHWRNTHREQRRTSQRQRRAEQKKPIEAACTVCSKKFVSSRTSSKYCSVGCYNFFRRNLRKSAAFKEKEAPLSKLRYKKMRDSACRRLKVDLRCRVNRAIKSNYKVGSAVRDLDCSIEYLKRYLESKFQPGMSWDNRGRHGWYIDHIKPLNSFNLADSCQFKLACHYTNLQPLWARDNMAKGDKYE
jgi:hypothetical protein